MTDKLERPDLEQRAREMLGDHTRIKLRQAIEGPILKRMYSGALEGKAGYDGTIYIADEIIANLEALASSSVPEQTLQAEAIDIVRRFMRATDDKGHLNLPAIQAAQDRARSLFAKIASPAPQDRGASQEDGR